MSATLQGIIRDQLGSRYARRLRAQGRIPASLRGRDKASLDFSIPEDEFLAARRHHEHLFDLALGKGKKETAMVRELQWDPFGERVLHVEFRRVVRGQKTEVEVELEFSGHPKGGVLNHLVTHITVSCLPSVIPDVVEVFVDELEIGHKILAADLKLPDGVTIAVRADTPIAVVSTVRALEVATEAEEGEVLEGEAAEAAEAVAEGKAGEPAATEES